MSALKFVTEAAEERERTPYPIVFHIFSQFSFLVYSSYSTKIMNFAKTEIALPTRKFREQENHTYYRQTNHEY